MARPRLEIQELTEMSFPHFNTYLTQISMFSFQNEWPIKTKAVYTLVLFHIFIHFLVKIGSDHNLIFVNLQAVASSKKCCFKQ